LSPNTLPTRHTNRAISSESRPQHRMALTP
jgi:hypothetical protein